MNKSTYAKYDNHHVCSDIHLNHKNIALYCPESRGQFVKQTGADADGTPTYTHYIDEMNEQIISNWNSVVQPDDHTFIVGDFAMGIIDKAPALIKRMNGAKTLIRGNHDHKIVQHPEVNELFIDVRDYLCFNVLKTPVVMCHFPFASWDRQSQGAVHLHGHLHSPAGKLHIAPGRIMDVGIDGNNLFPRELEATVQYLIDTFPPRGDHHQ